MPDGFIVYDDNNDAVIKSASFVDRITPAPQETDDGFEEDEDNADE